MSCTLGLKSIERKTAISILIKKITESAGQFFKKLQNNTYYYQKKVTDFVKKGRTVKILHILRNYSALVVVVSSALLVAATNMVASNKDGLFLLDYWNKKSSLQTSGNNINMLNRKSDLAFISLAKASTAVDPNAKIEENNLNFIQNQSLMASAGTPLKDPEEDGGVKIYEIIEGDILSAIAEKNHITINTILWANDIENVDSVMPGDKIFILPIAGVSHTIKSGESLELIAQKYKADKDKIIAFNDLPADGNITEGEEIIIPDGQKEIPNQTNSNSSTGIARREYATQNGGIPTTISGWKSLDGKAGTGYKFPYGYCTWYVAKKRYIPWSGNAGTWLYHAKTSGYKTGKNPQVGAIMVSSESWWGHVAIVENVGKDSFTISEMNYKGWNKINKRIIAKSSRVVKGFIY